MINDCLNQYCSAAFSAGFYFAHFEIQRDSSASFFIPFFLTSIENPMRLCNEECVSITGSDIVCIGLFSEAVSGMASNCAPLGIVYHR